MSLKQKSEAAFLKLIENAALFTGQLLRSDQNQTTTLSPPAVSAIYTPLGDRPSSRGQRTGQEAGLLSVVIRSPADKEDDDADPDADPEAVHASNVDSVRASIVIAGLVGAVNAAAVQPYCCLSARPTRPPVIAVPARTFQDIFTWEINHVEVDCG
jgi:hypothetical protein